MTEYSLGPNGTYLSFAHAGVPESTFLCERYVHIFEVIVGKQM